MAKLSIQLSASMKELRKGLKNAQKAVADWKTKVARIGKVALGVGAGALAAGLAAAAKRAVQLAANFQQTQVAFRTMVGDSQKAAALIDALTEFSTKTPFTPEQVQKAAKTLLAFGFAAKDVRGTLKLLGDVSAGTGKDLSEMAVIFGQIKSAGRLMGQDLLQLINAGFNPLQVMSDKTGKSMAQLKEEMSKGLITFKDVEQAFIDATSAGGIFFNMMEEQSKTVGGKISTLKGNWDKLLKTIAGGTTGTISDLLDKLNELVGALDEVAKTQDSAADGAKGFGLLLSEWGKQVSQVVPGLKQALDLAEKLGLVDGGIELAAPTAGQKGAARRSKEEADKEIADAKREAKEKERIAGEMAFGEGFGKSPSELFQEAIREARKKAAAEVAKQQAADARKSAQEGLREGIAVNQERARQLEKEIGMAFRPGSEIASNLSRIGGERGIAIAANVPEKQLAELKAINDGIKIMQDAIKSIDSTPKWPGGN